MINGTLEEFFEKLLLGEEIWLLFRGRSMLLQGWYDPVLKKEVLCLDDLTPDGRSPDEPLWRHEAPEKKTNAEAFLGARLFDGCPFLEAEEEIEWPFDGDVYACKPKDMSCGAYLAERKDLQRIFRYTPEEKAALLEAAMKAG